MLDFVGEREHCIKANYRYKKLRVYRPFCKIPLKMSPRLLTMTFALLGVLRAVSGALSAPVQNSTSSRNIILRDLALPRYFGAAMNTTFLFHDQAYTKLIQTQVRH